MKSGAVFFSNPELSKLVDQNLCLGLQYRVCSNEGQTLVDDVKEVKKFQEHKMTKFLGVLNGTGVGNTIGEGRFGYVLLATHMGTMEKIAVKEYLDSFHDEVMTGRVENSKMFNVLFLEHPAILKIFEVNMCRGICYTVMELGQRNAYDYVMEHGSYNEDNAKDAMTQLVGAVEFLHQQGIVHGSIHPKNLIMFKEGVMKLSDVATGQLLKWLPYSRTSLLVLPYVAPELKENGLVDSRETSDMWSVGACLHFLVSGASPFDGATRDIIERAVQTGTFRVPILADHNCRQVLHGLLKVNPSKRMTIHHVKNHGWFGRKDIIKEKLVEVCAKLLSDQKEPELVQEVELIKSSTEASDEGYQSTGSEPPSDKEGNENVKLWKQYDNTRVDDNAGLLVYVTDNNRENWDPKVLRIEKCRLMTGSYPRTCLRFAIPVKFQDNPDYVARFQAANARLECLPNMPAVIDSDYGDYSLMDFYGDGVRLCHQLRNGTKFRSSKHAARYYNRQNADRLWNFLNLTRCENCMDPKFGFQEHVEENCIYKYWEEASPSNEAVFWNQEDEYNVRVFINPLIQEKNETPRVSRLTRFRKGSVKFFSNGVQRIVRRFRRQPQISPTSK